MKRKENKVNLFLDSGAFSAWSQKIEIDINQYINFIKEHESMIDAYANLDVIGSAEGTWKNQIIMEKAGLKPIPVFHYMEDTKWLKRYLKKEYNYIALGGMVGIKSDQLISWLDRLWGDDLTDSSGMPILKVHGFGLTSLRLMLRYPWYSVDSTSWVVTGRMGGIFMPRWSSSKKIWVYDDSSLKIMVSNRSPSKTEFGKHINTLNSVEKRIALSYIEEKGYKLGKSEFRIVDSTHVLAENEKWAEKKRKESKKRKLEIILEPGVSNKYQLRDEMNILYFLDLEKAMPEWPWSFKSKNKNRTFNL